ncbi:MAG: hypothetical protein Alis3KO_28950 [Aliiglaciecola sp.]
MERRKFLQILSALCVTGVSTPFYLGASQRNQKSVLNKDSHALLHRLCDLIIPESDSPGAIKAGVVERFDFALFHMTEDEQRLWRADLTRVHTALNQYVKGDFMSLPKQKQTLLLYEFDTLAYKNAPTDESIAYRQLKKEIGSAYYTTELGMTQELRYLPVPGKWEACIPFSDVGRTWAK